MLSHVASVSVALAVVGLLIAMNAVEAGACLLLLLESFPSRVRASGLSIIYSVGVSILGGFAQFIVTWLISVTENPIFPARYVMARASATVYGALRIREVQRSRQSSASSGPELFAG